MKNVFSYFIIIFIIMFSMLTCAEKEPGFTPKPGMWSTQGVNISYIGLDLRNITKISSPDSEIVIEIKDHDLYVQRKGELLAGTEEEWVCNISELLWSPDSKAFAITNGCGGYVGEYLVRVYIVKNGVIQPFDVNEIVIEDAMKRYKCVPDDPEYNEQPNIGAIKWLNDSKELLSVAQVPPHSSCPDMGKLFGYVIAVPSGEILDFYEEDQLVKQWGNFFGKRLEYKLNKRRKN